MAISASSTAPALIGSTGDSLREAFGRSLSELAQSTNDIVVLDADIAGGTGAHHFRRDHPDRFFQFGIAEQNMMAVAGGMAATGLVPVCDDICRLLPACGRTGASVHRLCQPEREDRCFPSGP